MTENFFITSVCVISLVLGSFANVCIHRAPRGRSVAVPRSRCPKCHREIAWYDNIPVLSWCWLRARCRQCGEKISIRYPLVELLMVLLFLSVYFLSDSVSHLVFGLILTFVLIVISIIDLDWRIIPDIFSLGLLGIGIVVSPINEGLGDSGPVRAFASVAGAGVGFGSAWLMSVLGRRVFKREALGGGDVKLLAGVGAFLGWSGVLTSWFLGSVLGSTVFVGLKFRRKMEWGTYLPFGPFLAAGAWAHWAWPGFFLKWWGLDWGP
jgi:leader peptidase (prepilin peptidase)/N-methyltransferase